MPISYKMSDIEKSDVQLDKFLESVWCKTENVLTYDVECPKIQRQKIIRRWMP